MNHFDAAYLCASPFFLGASAYKRWRYGKYRRSLPGMFGANLPNSPLKDHEERVWMHSVSVGETIASAAVFRVLKEKQPGWEFLITTTTETGQDQARRGLIGAEHFDFAPVDFSWKVDNFLRAYNPSMYLFFETEIWPNILLGCGRRKMPVFLVNGKLSDRSSHHYARLKGILGKPLSSVSAFLMQTESDAERIRRVVGANANVHVTGNVKFDNLPEPLSSEQRKEMRGSWGTGDEEFLILAGSTHDPEEKLIYEAYTKLKCGTAAPGCARLAIAPRHPERFDAVAEQLRELGANVWRLSEEGTSPGPDSVLLLDKMGILGRSFGSADLALVGGSWKPIGGHNLLEPAAHGTPVFHGPHMHEQKEIMRIVRKHKAAREVAGENLAEEIEQLISDEELRRKLSQNGREAARANRGAAHRAVEIILDSYSSSANAS